jgi:hypothetical protein
LLEKKFFNYNKQDKNSEQNKNRKQGKNKKQGKNSKRDYQEFLLHYFLAEIFYGIFDFDNEQLSLPTDLKTHLSERAYNFECFGSCFNTFGLNEYCSLFFDLFEQKFGSRGNFFDYNFEKQKKYICNPPY